MNEQLNPITDALQTKCKSCGGMMEYSPGDENLKCVYCGQISELDHSPAEIKENSFEEWKACAEESNEEQTMELTQVKCRQCGATTSLAPNISATKCAFCSTPLILDRASVKRFWQPEYMLPFKISKKQSNESFQQWLKNKWFLPSKLKKSSVDADGFKGVYLPFWTYDANTCTQYTGERGINRTETYRDEKGEEKKRTVTDWYLTEGEVEVNFDDIMVPATSTLPSNMMEQFCNRKWDMQNCIAYQEEYTAGFITEIYQIDFREGVIKAKEKMKSAIDTSIREDIGGDRQKIKSKHIQYNDLMFKLLLLPIWISAFTINDKIYQFVVNGRTGEVIGEYPKDKKKIALLVIVIIAIIWGIMQFTS